MYFFTGTVYYFIRVLFIASATKLFARMKSPIGQNNPGNGFAGCDLFNPNGTFQAVE